MSAGLLADLVLLLHLGFIVFALFGAMLTLRWIWAALLHLPALAWATFIQISSGICPLTPLENSLRHAAGESSYSSSFVEHYLIPLVYPPGLTSRAQIWLATGLVLFNVLLYTLVLVRRHKSRRRAA